MDGPLTYKISGHILAELKKQCIHLIKNNFVVSNRFIWSGIFLMFSLPTDLKINIGVL